MVLGLTSLADNAATIGELYDEYKDLDGLLYISYSMENTFG